MVTILAFTLSQAPAAESVDCAAIGAELKKAAAAEPERVLVLVEDAIIRNEECACEIVKAAIVSTKADKEWVKQIVFTAISAAQGMAATIAECAIASAPGAAEEIKVALEEALIGGGATATAYVGEKSGSKAPTNSKAPGYPTSSEGSTPAPSSDNAQPALLIASSAQQSLLLCPITDNGDGTYQVAADAISAGVYQASDGNQIHATANGKLLAGNGFLRPNQFGILQIVQEKKAPADLKFPMIKIEKEADGQTTSVGDAKAMVFESKDKRLGYLFQLNQTAQN